ncbi:hypothetical protein [Aurantiacibacter suaedae]|uniref:hypothetical protein n=1 Tax=Aurantiacibacter suaedae TaxID=2545755 RepID=UPI0010F90669|nr:hypothetical protein [Aurantiacibacter suaedae]
MSDDKRAALKERIEAGQDSEATRRAKKLGDSAKAGAVEAKDKFTAFAKEHPVTTVAGGVVAGVMIASLFKTPRRAAARTGAKAAGLAALGSEMAMGFLAELRDDAGHAGKEGKRKLADLADSANDKARRARRDAKYRARNAGDDARIAGREVGKSIMRAFKIH